jgi:DNA-binding NarL/FixJ family response regulator
MGATFTAIQLHKLVAPQTDRIGEPGLLTARELAVLRLLAAGDRVADAAQSLELGEETVRSP